MKLPYLPFKLGQTNIVLKHVSQENMFVGNELNFKAPNGLTRN